MLDLSAVHHDPEALTLVMIATTAWLQAVLARPDGPPRLQVLDEAWSLLGSERTTRYLQACWKLSRAYGVANLAIVHRLSDLRSQADDGTSASKMSMGLLADTQTRVLFRQSTDQVREASELLGLTAPEATLLPRLAKGRALWKVGDRTAVVAHVIGAVGALVLRHRRAHGGSMIPAHGRERPANSATRSNDALLGQLALAAVAASRTRGRRFVVRRAARRGRLRHAGRCPPASQVAASALRRAAPATSRIPAAAWPADARAALPGPIVYWACTFTVAVLVAGGTARIALRWWRRVGSSATARWVFSPHAGFARARRPTPA